MKYVLCITQRCNLACNYCYIGKKNARMPLSVAKKIIDFMFSNTPLEERIEIAFFGGEPLLEFDLITKITEMIENHPVFSKERVDLSIVTNGTIFTNEIADFVNKHNMVFGISCDGHSVVQNKFRRFADGKPSSDIVKNTIKLAIKSLPCVLVNSVHNPITFKYLPQVLDYFSSLGLRRIYLNPDYSAIWTKPDIKTLPEVYGWIGEKYINYYIQGTPRYISLIDNKIAVILRGGYKTDERCRMGSGEFAFAPNGNVYPCERLIENGDENSHFIGNVNTGIELSNLSCNNASGGSINKECMTCGIKEYCMNWCGCSNFMSTGYYNRVGAFLCASEKSAVQTAFNVFQILEKKLGPTFAEHLAGSPDINSALN